MTNKTEQPERGRGVKRALKKFNRQAQKDRMKRHQEFERARNKGVVEPDVTGMFRQVQELQDIYSIADDQELPNETFVVGLRSKGEVTFQINYVPEETVIETVGKVTGVDPIRIEFDPPVTLPDGDVMREATIRTKHYANCKKDPCSCDDYGDFLSGRDE